MRRLGTRLAGLLGLGALTLALATSSSSARPPEDSDPPGGMSLLGQISPIHDPALHITDDGTWYVYSTGLINRENGGTIQMWSSHDEGTTWTYDGTIWPEIPAWIDDHFAGGPLPDNLWAPEIHRHDGTYYLYYSASRFGTDTSVTALATNTTLDPSDPAFEWVDQGPVITSPVSGLADDKIFNAIDAGIVIGEDGEPWMAIGSFWYGIFLVPLEWPSGMPVADWQSRTVHLADRFMAGNPIEAAYITTHGDHYYLFVSFGHCCQGANSTYQIAVGRSDSVTGPYLDMAGEDLNGGGGTILLETEGTMVGPGGQSVFGDYLAFHYYDGANAEIPYFPTLGLHKMRWEDGWPVVDTRSEFPLVATGPADLVVTAGQDAVLTSGATGIPRPVAQWEFSTDDGRSWTTIAAPTDRSEDEATSELSIGAADLVDGTQVRVAWSNPFGRVVSGVASITVTDAQGTPTPTGSPSEDESGTDDGSDDGTGGDGSASAEPSSAGESMPDTGASVVGVLAVTAGLLAAGLLIILLRRRASRR